MVARPALVPVAARGEQPIGAEIKRLVGANQRLQSEIAARLNLGAEWQADVLFRAMLDQVPDYVFVKDRESRFVVANRVVADDLGCEPEAIIGKTDFELHAPDLAEKFYADEQHVMQTGEPLIDIEEFVVDTNGGQKFLLTSKVPLRDSDGDVVGLVGISRNVTARRVAEDEVRFLARHDPLTRLPNRSHLMERLGEAIRRARASGQRVAIAFVDLDGFKAVNDTFGHAAGDDLLRTIAARLLECVRPTDTVARLGGDEFVIVLADQADARLVERIVEKAQAAVAMPVDLADTPVLVSCSIGTATWPEDGDDPAALLRCADARMYRAKDCTRR